MGRRCEPHLELQPLGVAVRTRTCRLCRKALEDKRRTAWCGDACVTAWRLANGDAALLRRLVKARDACRCAGCGVDVELVRRVVDRLLDLGRERHADGHRSGPVPPDSVMAGRVLLVALGWSRGRAEAIVPSWCWGHVPELWEADHVVAVVLGGRHDLENLRTLCHPCHDRATAKLAADRAAERRRARAAAAAVVAPPLPGMEA